MTGSPSFPWPAASVLGGCLAGSLLGRITPTESLALAAAGLALGSALGRRLALGACGALAMSLTPPALGTPTFLDPSRPVMAIVRATAPARDAAFGWSLPVRFEVLRQGPRVERWPAVGFVSLPASPPAGDRYRLVGFLARAPGYANGGPTAPGPWRLRVKSLRFVKPLPYGWRGAWRVRSGELRRRLRSALEVGGPTRGSSVARGLLLGEGEALPEPLRRCLRRFGVAHLTAVSGLHVSLLIGLGVAVGHLLPRPLRWLPALTAGGGYLLVIGPRPALLRATLMASLAGAALRHGRLPQGLHALGAAAAMLTLSDPRGLRELGLQLTLAATAGILLSEPLWAARWGAFGRSPLGRALAASAGAQVCTWPWALPAFHALTPIAPLANLALVPWAAGMLVLSATVAVAGVLGLPFPGPRWLDFAVAPLGGLESLPAHWVGLVPLSLGPWSACLLAAAVAAGLRWPRHGALAGLLFSLGAIATSEAAASPELRVLDVGQGEALLVTDSGRAVLVDGGGWVRGDPALAFLLPALAQAGVRSLDAVILTHPDLDHCGGLAGLVDYLPVAELWTPSGWPATGCVLELLVQPGVRWRPLWAGEVRRLGRWTLRALHPPAGARRTGNDGSLVLAAEALGVRLLLTGDIEAAAERELLQRWGGGPLRADLLKLAHHGSRTSTTSALLEAVQPRLAVVSAGRGNRYGHPSARVLERLARSGVPVLSTHRSGQIRLRVVGAGGRRFSLVPAGR